MSPSCEPNHTACFMFKSRAWFQCVFLFDKLRVNRVGLFLCPQADLYQLEKSGSKSNRSPRDISQDPISPSEYIPEYIQYSMRSKYASNTIRLHHLHICSTRLRLVAARMHSPWAGPISTNQSALASLFLFVRILSKTSLITY